MGLYLVAFLKLYKNCLSLSSSSLSPSNITTIEVFCLQFFYPLRIEMLGESRLQNTAKIKVVVVYFQLSLGHGVPDFEFGRKKLSPQVTTDSDTVFSRGIHW